MDFVERRVRQELRRQVEFHGGERLVIGLSGGKDSSTVTVLLHDILAPRRDIELVAVTVDEGIEGYRPEGLRHAQALCASLDIEHRTFSYKATVGFEMDEIVRLDPAAIPCSYCGVYRRRTLNAAARELAADHVVTGLNLDDTAQSILMNIARGDVEKLARLGPHDAVQPGLIPRLQPLRLIPEKEVYLYALLRGIAFHDGTCPHADRAQRQRFREIIAQLEGVSPGTRHAIVSAHDELRPLLLEKYPPREVSRCERCGEPATNRLCRACTMTERLAGMA